MSEVNIWYATLVCIAIISGAVGYYRGAYSEAKNALRRALSDLENLQRVVSEYRNAQMDFIEKITSLDEED